MGALPGMCGLQAAHPSARPPWACLHPSHARTTPPPSLSPGSLLPIRDKGNWLLCTLLIANTVANVFLPILVASFAGGLVAFVASTVLTLLFAEIVPQVRRVEREAGERDGGRERGERDRREGQAATPSRPPAPPAPCPPCPPPRPLPPLSPPRLSRPPHARQAICSRHGLFLAAHLTWLLRGMMWLLAPISWPLAWVLDKVLGREVGTLYSRAELKHLITLHVEHPDAGGGGGGGGGPGGGPSSSALTREDYKVLAGALGIRDRRVRDVMTPIGRTFMVAASTRLSFRNMLAIYESGYTRIPVHEDGDRQAIIGILYAKDLILVDPDDEIEVRAIIALRAGVDDLGWSGAPGGVADAAAAAGSLAGAIATTPRAGGVGGGGGAGAGGPPPAHAHAPAPTHALTAPLDAGGVQYVLDATPLNEVFKLFKTCGTHLMVACRLREGVPPGGGGGGGSATNGKAVAAALKREGGGSGAAAPPPLPSAPLTKSGTASAAFWLAASPGREVTGVITLEDVLEEVIQDEIVDESDAFVSNDQTTRVVRSTSRGGKGGRVGGGGAASSYLSLFEHKRRDASRLSSAEVTAAAAFLSASVAEFRRFAPADAVLKGLIRQAEVIDCCADAASAAAAGGGSLSAAAASLAGLAGGGAEAAPGGGSGPPSPRGSPRAPTPPPAGLSRLARGDSGGSDGGTTGAATPSGGATGGPGGSLVGEIPLYARGVPACHLTLVLQGRVAVRAGSEEFASDLGPWSVLGAKALGATPDDPYIPDFCADALPPARVLRIHADAYRVAVRVAAANAVAAGRAVKQALYGTTLRAMSGLGGPRGAAAGVGAPGVGAAAAAAAPPAARATVDGARPPGPPPAVAPAAPAAGSAPPSVLASPREGDKERQGKE